MKHYYKKDGDNKWLRIMNDVTNGRPELAYGNDDIRPYWKRFGTGSERLMVEVEVDGSFLVRGMNYTEGAKSGKEVWLHLDKDTAAIVGAFLQGRAPAPLKPSGTPATATVPDIID
jgi:hypothetical protein